MGHEGHSPCTVWSSPDTWFHSPRNAHQSLLAATALFVVCSLNVYEKINSFAANGLLIITEDQQRLWARFSSIRLRNGEAQEWREGSWARHPSPCAVRVDPCTWAHTRVHRSWQLHACSPACLQQSAASCKAKSAYAGVVRGGTPRAAGARSNSELTTAGHYKQHPYTYPLPKYL